MTFSTAVIHIMLLQRLGNIMIHSLTIENTQGPRHSLRTWQSGIRSTNHTDMSLLATGEEDTNLPPIGSLRSQEGDVFILIY